jgi:hypothetical protein
MASGAMGGMYFERAAADWLFMNIDHSTYFHVYKSKEQNTCLIVPRQKDTEMSALTFVISSDSLLQYRKHVMWHSVNFRKQGYCLFRNT